MNRRLVAWSFVWALSSISAGCNARRPHVAESSGRAPITTEGRASQSETKTGPVEVTYVAPRGELEAPLEISVAFDRPMVALGTDDAAADALHIEPAIAGRARWLGSQTLLFEPNAPVAMATEFRVRVNEGLHALDGQPLAKPIEFSFSTPVPKIVRTDPGNGSSGVERRAPLDLYFNQRIDLERVREFGALSVREGKRPATNVPFTVEQPDPSNAKLYRIVAKKVFPLGAEVTFTLRAGLPSQEGPRTAPEAIATTFQVFGPFRLVANPPCRDADCVAKISFTNPVSTEDLAARLRFEPKLAQPFESEYDYETDELYFGAELKASTTYKVTVEGDLRDSHGNALQGPRTVTVQTPPYPAYARVLVEGDLVAQKAGAVPPHLRMQLQNVQNARVELTSLAANEVFPTELTALRPKATATVQQLGNAGPAERRVAEIDPAPLLKNGHGIVWVRLLADGQGEKLHEESLIAFTDLAPALKVGADGGMVWVTQLSDAKPVAGANVRIVRNLETLATGQTDANGLFKFQFEKTDEDLSDLDVSAVVQRGDDVSFARKFAGNGPWDLTDRSAYAPEGNASAHLFTERGVYRPGDSLQLKGIVRTQDPSGTLPARGEVSMRARDASDSEVTRATATLDEYGTFDQVVRIPGSIELGPLAIDVDYEGQTFSTVVEVAEFRAAEFEVSMRMERERALRGETAKAKLEARYLFGARAKGGRVYWSAQYKPRSFGGPTYEGFSFHDARGVRSDDNLSAYAGSGDSELDAAGGLPISVALDKAPTGGPTELSIEASVVVGNAQGSKVAAIDVTPASVVVGVSASHGVSEAKKPLDVRAVALTPEGEVANGVALEVTLDRRILHTEDVDGRRVSRWDEQRVGSCKKQSGREPVLCKLTPVEPGVHIARVRGKDAKGRVSSAAHWVYVYGAGIAAWDEEPGHVIELHAERTRYKLGDTARILVASPFPEAEAWVTVERQGVMSAERVTLGTANTIDVRIDERFVPNAFVSVLLVQPLSSQADVLDYRIGAIELTADVSERKLGVEVTPDAAEKRPGDTVSLSIAVRDGAGVGKQAALTVFAVDEGVLALTNYQTPDPFASIYAPRALGVWTSDARASLAHILEGSSDKGGDEGGGGGQLMRTNFAAVAMYVPRVETDANGRAKLEFKLPDSTTRYRIMAVAASRGAEVGSGDASVRTKKPLMLRPQLPRLLRAGDQLSAGVVVHNELDQDVDADVELEARGLVLSEAAKRRVHVPAHGATDLRYALRAEQVGDAKLTFRARAGREEDAIAVTRQVASPVVPESISVAGATESSARETLATLRNLRPDVGGLDVKLSTSALSELETPARQLLAYPYGCTEQLSSRLVAIASLERLRGPLSLKDPPFAKVAEPMLSELERHQRGDGGFGLWSATDATPESLAIYLTSYALLALEQVRASGITVSPHAIDRAKQYLASTLRAQSPAQKQSLAPVARTFVVYALARVGAYDPGYAGLLFEQRAELPTFARVELAHALARDPARHADLEQLLTEIATSVRVGLEDAHIETNRSDAYATEFVSDVRATSELLLFLLEAAPDHMLVPKLARWLSEVRTREGAWTSTQETAWALMAQAAYLAKKESTRPDMKATVQVGDRDKFGPAALSGHLAKVDFHMPMRDVPQNGGSVLFAKSGAGTLHYALRLAYAEAALPSAPTERGFFVQRTYERIDPAALARGEVDGAVGDRAKVGDYVRVTLRVAVPSARRFVMISDPLPAGLEPVDFTLATELAGAARAFRSWAPTDHHELRDDRALFAVNDLPPGLYRYTYLARASNPGVFVAPAAKVEEMYHPSTYGSTPAQGFTVEP